MVATAIVTAVVSGALVGAFDFWKDRGVRREEEKRAAAEGEALRRLEAEVHELRGQKDAHETERPTTKGDAGRPRNYAVTVLYGTDRNVEDPLALPADVYGGEQGDVSYGVCEVTIPADHRQGVLESPLTVFGFRLAQDPDKHLVLTRVKQYPSRRFFELLSSEAKERGVAGRKRQLLVFVHGFRNTFEDAARRTAQLAHDLHYDGIPIFWSWPSGGNLALYMHDETNVRYTEDHFEQFLRDIAKSSEADTIHLVAHSMGNQCLTEVLRRLDSVNAVPASVREVVLAAPDIDAATFRRDIAPKIVGPSRRVTLYASSRDIALQASRRLHGGARAGDSGGGIVIVPPMETIDATSVDTSLDGHAYIADNSSVLSDLFNLLRGEAPAHRFGMSSKVLGGRTYWVFDPRERP
jgi:esterase/lipase superfamily enzyme